MEMCGPALKGMILLILSSSSIALGSSHTIIVENMKFTPDKLEIKPGDAVVWLNKDYFPHTATSNEKAFDSGQIASGKTWKFRFKKKGAFPYTCTLHPTMLGSIEVK
jgi:plastocyanin